MFLLVTVLGGNQEGRAADELVMTFVDNTFRAVTIKEVDCKEQCGGLQLEGGMRFDEEIEEVWTHEPLDFSLNVNGFYIRESGSIHVKHVLQAVIEILLSCLGRELICDCVLTLTSNDFCVFLGIEARADIVGLNEVRITRLVRGANGSHDCGMICRKLSRS